MNLSEHFTLAEFTFSETASRKGISNDPPALMYATLKKTAEGMELVRSILGFPIRITSGYRSPELNAAVGSKGTSQHTLGEAVDFTCQQYGDPKKIVHRLKESSIKFDQLILEFFDEATGGGWVHISFGDKNRRQVLVIDKDGTRNYV